MEKASPGSIRRGYANWKKSLIFSVGRRRGKGIGTEYKKGISGESRREAKKIDPERGCLSDWRDFFKNPLVKVGGWVREDLGLKRRGTS